jgi:hypothetical protein
MGGAGEVSRAVSSLESHRHYPQRVKIIFPTVITVCGKKRRFGHSHGNNHRLSHGNLISVSTRHVEAVEAVEGWKESI